MGLVSERRAKRVDLLKHPSNKQNHASNKDGAKFPSVTRARGSAIVSSPGHPQLMQHTSLSSSPWLGTTQSLCRSARAKAAPLGRISKTAPAKQASVPTRLKKPPPCAPSEPSLPSSFSARLFPLMSTASSPVLRCLRGHIRHVGDRVKILRPLSLPTVPALRITRAPHCHGGSGPLFLAPSTPRRLFSRHEPRGLRHRLRLLL